MKFDLSEQQRIIVDTARRVGEDFGPDYWRKQDADKAFPREFWKAVCDAGLAGTLVPEEYGGSELGMFEKALIVETLAAAGGGATVGQLFMVGPIFGGLAIQRFGSTEMKKEYLPKIANGLIVAMALTEPDAGSNSLEIQTFAERDGNGWKLNGRKMWTTAMEAADKVLVIARTTKIQDAPKKTFGLSLFMIDVKRMGLEFSPIEKLGTNTLSSSNVFFDDVQIDGSELVGELDNGWRQLLDILNTERIAATASLVGTGELATRLGVAYANDRKVFGGKPISSYQGLQFPLAQAYVEIESARLMNYKAAWLFDNGRDHGAEANIAKLISARAAELATDRAMQMMGGMGYAKDSHVERLWRDARLFRIAPISEEMIYNFVAMQNLGMPRSY
ncbi:MAG: acyl-CoA dehydrogenase [Candidatus Marinimicrobia bacterium]|nr:acyl-CoA dehydrogenase [Candidatus Neomarinimicrobiota bacterium]